MADLVHYLTNWLWFEISFLFYYINFNLLITFCICSGEICSFVISIDFTSFCDKVSELLCGELFDILFAILLQIKSSVASPFLFNFSG